MKKLLLAWLIGLGTLAIALPGMAETEEKSWHFTQWHNDITINSDGSLSVVEYTEAEFVGSFSWITRSIAQQGSMTIEDIVVIDAQTEEDITDQVNIYSGYLSTDITIYHDTDDEKQDWYIYYQVENATTNFDDYDELYWNAVSDDRDVPIDVASTVVHLPDEVDAGDIQQRILSGYYGTSEEEGEYEVMDDGTLFYQITDLAAYTNFTIVAGFPKGLIPDPPRISIEPDTDPDIYLITGDHTREYVGSSLLYVGDDIPSGELLFELEEFGHHTQRITVDTPNSGIVRVSVEMEPENWYTLLMVAFIIIVLTYIISPLFVFFAMYILWRERGRDIGGTGVIIPQYEPYQSLTPGEMGIVIDEKADLEDITATLIDLAIRKYIRIHDKKGAYSFELLQLNYKTDQTFKAHETLLLESVFTGTKTLVTLSSLKYEFASSVKSIRDTMYNEVTSGGLFIKNPERVRRRYRIFGVLLIFLGVVATALYFIGIPVIVYGIIILMFSRTMPKKTKQGVQAFEWSKGFEMFLHHAERYRIERMTIDNFERMLPYAIVFGVEEEWAKQFDELYTKAPDWYAATSGWSNGFTASTLAHTLSSSMLPATTKNFTAVRSSSGSYSSSGFGSASGGSSGFSGGGFSGGGFGGGGSSAG